MDANYISDKEVRNLRIYASLIMSWLIIFVVGCIIVLLIYLNNEVIQGNKLNNIIICILSGTLGSAISALISSADRISHGWELNDGKKIPQGGKEDKFVARMIPFFLIRPFLGSVMGFLIYVGIIGGFLIAVQNTESTSFSREGLIFLSLLGGLFAKTFLEKLRSMFDTLFGK